MSHFALLPFMIAALMTPADAQDSRTTKSDRVLVALSSGPATTDDALATLLIGSWSTDCAVGGVIVYAPNGTLEGNRRTGRWRLVGDVLTETYIVQADPADPGETDMRFTRRSRLTLNDDGSILKRGVWLSGGDVGPDLVLMRCQTASAADVG